MITVHKSKKLSGFISIPGDKSISHRAIIFGSLCVGKTTVIGLLESEDVQRTIEAVRQLGAKVEKKDGKWEVYGFGVGGFTSPENVIDCGNSGTTCRLIMGAISTTPVSAIFVGDKSLSQRPMDRVIEPLSRIGVKCSARDGSFLPITLEGISSAMPSDFEAKVDSAQVKSAILLAGLNSRGTTKYVERTLTRDHTERMLMAFGGKIKTEKTENGYAHYLQGLQELKPQEILIPSDPSSASFFIATALMVEGSDITIKNICMNETRIGFLKVVNKMGARIEVNNKKKICGELVADLRVKYSRLRGVEVPENLVASMIDEFPILSVLAAFAEGKTEMRKIGELKVKESDRIFSMAKGLRQCGVDVEFGEEYMIVKGKKEVRGGQMINTFNDHRIAMSFICLGQVAQRPIKISEAISISTSFPGFIEKFKEIGANLSSQTNQ
ncbi:MAG: 3-phosphoshikimate 1-carboxyvinyltransferase [Paracoccaceae bacterium]